MYSDSCPIIDLSVVVLIVRSPVLENYFLEKILAAVHQVALTGNVAGRFAR